METAAVSRPLFLIQLDLFHSLSLYSLETDHGQMEDRRYQEEDGRELGGQGARSDEPIPFRFPSRSSNDSLPTLTVDNGTYRSDLV